MPRFKSRIDGFMQRKPHWICRDCQTVFTVHKPTSCSHCGHRKFMYFASKREYSRYTDLILLERAGEITDLELQPAYVLTIGTDTYRCVLDYRYKNKDGVEVVEDVKTAATNTDLSKIKRSLVEHQHGIKVVLV